MKKVWWIIRFAVIVTASYCIFVPSGSYLRNVRATEGDGCDTAQTCARNSESNCYCPVSVVGGPGCSGCFVPNGSSGCGSCSTGPRLAD
jgi:hypothetical protein